MPTKIPELMSPKQTVAHMGLPLTTLAREYNFMPVKNYGPGRNNGKKYSKMQGDAILKNIAEMGAMYYSHEKAKTRKKTITKKEFAECQALISTKKRSESRHALRERATQQKQDV